jgi:hypothetical protein
MVKILEDKIKKKINLEVPSVEEYERKGRGKKKLI